MTTEIILIASYFAAKAIQDATLSAGKGFNPKSKYKQPLISISHIKSDLYRSYHEFVGANYIEKFPFSASFLVMYTDAWHFAGFLRHLSVFFMVYHISDLRLLHSLIVYLSGLVVFNLTYTTLKKLL